MARPHVSVRAAVPDDLPDLLAMWGELREVSGRTDRTTPAPSEPGVLARLHAAQEDPDTRIVVATLDGEVGGMAVLTTHAFAPLYDTTAVHLHYLHVRPGHRRRGIGRALVASAVAFADETGAEHVITSVYPGLREANRFYARLGFGPIVVRRVAPVATLRRRLAAETAGRQASRAEELLLARRRTMRRVRSAVGRVPESSAAATAELDDGAVEVSGEALAAGVLPVTDGAPATDGRDVIDSVAAVEVADGAVEL